MEPTGVEGIDTAAAAAAIDGAGGVDHLIATQGQEAPTPPAAPEPQVQPTPDGSVPPAQPRQYERDEHGRFASPQEQAAAEAEAQAAEDAFTNIDPSTLPPELQAIYRNMQADYTRKTQAAAPFRSLAEEIGVDDPDEIRAAWELRETLSDPQNWQDLYSELGQRLQAMGLTPAEAQAAVEEAARQEQAPAPGPDLSVLDNDPELAPIRQAFESLQSEIAQIKDGFAAEREAAQREQQRAAVFGELQRQDAVIRQENPSYEDTDLEVVWELSSGHEGNLLAAQERLENYVQTRIERYLAQKESAVPAVSAPPQPGAPAEQPSDGFRTIDEAHEAATEHLRQIGLDIGAI